MFVVSDKPIKKILIGGAGMISTKGRYALRLMIDLAENADTGLTPLKDIAERQDISKKYLEIIIKDLVLAGMVEGTSGKNGGYRLSRKPEEYTVGEILETEEGTLATVACLAKDINDCPRREKCRTLSMWEEFDSMVQDYFFSKKLSDFLQP